MSFFSKSSRCSSTVALYLGVTLVAGFVASNERDGRVGRGDDWGRRWWNFSTRTPACQLQQQPARPDEKENLDSGNQNPSSLYPDVRPPARPWTSWWSLFRGTPKDWRTAYQRYQEALLRNDEYQAMPDPATVMIDSHAIAGALLKEHHIEAYRIFAQTATTITPPAASSNQKGSDPQVLEKRAAAVTSTTPQVVALVRVGTRVDGHYGIVHGGIVAMLVDDVLGYGFYSLGWPAAFTANLNLDYRQPLPAQTILRIECYLERQERRKLFWKVRVVDAKNPSTLFVEATSLFVIPKKFYDKHSVPEEN